MTIDYNPAAIDAAVATNRWAALVKLDVDVDVVGTWDRGLPRNKRILVPIDVQAMVVPDHERREHGAPRGHGQRPGAVRRRRRRAPRECICTGRCRTRCCAAHAPTTRARWRCRRCPIGGW